MIKIALVGAAFVAAGTTAAVTHPWSHAEPTAQVAAAPTIVEPAAPHAVREPALPAPKPQHVLPGPQPAPGERHVRVPAPDEMALLDRAAIAHAKVLQGPSKGPADAPVTITVYSDMVCPYCANALGTLDQLVDEYPGKIRIVMKQMPVHSAAVMPAEANYAADAQGKFWELHDLMAQHQDDLSRPAVEALAQQAGLDLTKFRAALDGRTYQASVDADMASAKELELQGTPAFVINGRRVIGNLPIETFRPLIDEALAHP